MLDMILGRREEEKKTKFNTSKKVAKNFGSENENFLYL